MVLSRITQKHFKAIAKILFLTQKKITKAQENDLEIDENLLFNDICVSLAEYFQTQNADFKRDLFIKECGLNDDSL